MSGIRKSSILPPAFRAETNHRGCLPRPDQVSDGIEGFWYLGKTLGYLRRGRSRSIAPAFISRTTDFEALPRVSWTSRFSSCCFSATIRSDRTLLICSWRAQRSSRGIPSRSSCSIVFQTGQLIRVILISYILTLNTATRVNSPANELPAKSAHVRVTGRGSPSVRRSS
jgi:hypothetical protein